MVFSCSSIDVPHKHAGLGVTAAPIPTRARSDKAAVGGKTDPLRSKALPFLDRKFPDLLSRLHVPNAHGIIVSRFIVVYIAAETVEVTVACRDEPTSVRSEQKMLHHGCMTPKRLDLRWIILAFGFLRSIGILARLRW